MLGVPLLIDLSPASVSTASPARTLHKRSPWRKYSEVPPQARRNLQELFVNFCLILICLLLMYIIVLLV